MVAHAERSGRSARYLHNDHRGTTYKITRADGGEVWSGLTDAYGVELGGGTPNQSIFWYQGQAWYRHEVGDQVLYVSPTRIYMPEDGRFVERDPFAEELGRATPAHPTPPNYMFGDQGVVDSSDPTGLNPVDWTKFAVVRNEEKHRRKLMFASSAMSLASIRKLVESAVPEAVRLRDKIIWRKTFNAGTDPKNPVLGGNKARFRSVVHRDAVASNATRECYTASFAVVNTEINLAAGTDIGSRVRVRPRLRAEELISTFLHEVGHSIGDQQLRTALDGQMGATGKWRVCCCAAKARGVRDLKSKIEASLSDFAQQSGLDIAGKLHLVINQTKLAGNLAGVKANQRQKIVSAAAKKYRDASQEIINHGISLGLENIRLQMKNRANPAPALAKLLNQSGAMEKADVFSNLNNPTPICKLVRV